MLRAYKGMRELGVDADEVLRRCDLQIASDDPVYVPFEDQLERHQRFWPVLEEVSGDPLVGLHLGSVIPVLSGQIVEYLFMSSPNFQEGLIRSSKYTRLLSDLFQMRVDLSDESCSVMYQLPGMASASLDQVYDCILVSNLRFFRHLTAGAFKPVKIALTRTAPASTAEYERVFGCPIEFSAQDNRVFFDPEILQLSSLHADPSMLILHEKMADEQIEKIEKQALLVEARRIIGEQLENGSPSLEMLSARLDMKVSRLRAHFAELDTSFNQVLSDYRFELAKKLLTRTEETIDQIVYLTGFSEPSTFYRAFKRWTGSTPIVYREQSRQERELEP